MLKNVSKFKSAFVFSAYGLLLSLYIYVIHIMYHNINFLNHI